MWLAASTSAGGRQRCRTSGERAFTEEMPDLRVEISQILASGDQVAYFSTNTGTSAIYQQSAIWVDCNIVRFKDGKIVEWWGVEDTLSQLRQFGFWILPPESRRNP